MELLSQDVVVLLRLSLEADSVPTYAALAQELKLTASEIHAGVDRVVAAQLACKDESGKSLVMLERFAFVCAARRALQLSGHPWPHGAGHVHRA